jgi:hypothetical protein
VQAVDAIVDRLQAFDMGGYQFSDALDEGAATIDAKARGLDAVGEVDFVAERVDDLEQVKGSSI